LLGGYVHLIDRFVVGKVFMRRLAIGSLFFCISTGLVHLVDRLVTSRLFMVGLVINGWSTDW